MNLLKDKSFTKEIIRLAAPIALQSLVSFLTVTAGNMAVSSLGHEATSSVYLSNQIQITVQFINTAVEAAALATIGQALGRGDKESALSHGASAILVSVIFSLFFSVPSFFIPEKILSVLAGGKDVGGEAARYLKMLSLSFPAFMLSQTLISVLRSIKRPKIGFFASLFSLAVNLSLNSLLIFGKAGFPHLGIFGAGISILAARLTELAIVLVYCFFPAKRIKLNFKKLFSVLRRALSGFLKTAYPLLLSQSVWCINSFFCAWLLSSYRGGSLISSAAPAIALYNLAYILPGSVTAALGVMAARKIGEDGGSEIKKSVFGIGLAFIVLGGISALFIMLGKLPFMLLWNTAEKNRALVGAFMNVMAITVIATSYQSGLLALIKSAKDMKFILKTEAFSVFALIIPISLLLNGINAGAIAVFAALKCDQLAKCPIAYRKLQKMSLDKRE